MTPCRAAFTGMALAFVLAPFRVTGQDRTDEREPISLVTAAGDSAAVAELLRGTGQWFTSSYLPEPIVIRINSRRDRQACEDDKEPLDFVQFSSATPNAGRDPNGRTLAPVWSDSLGCVVTFRWLLGNRPGEQQLVVRLVRSGENRPQPGFALVNPPIRVVAHEPPGLFIGVALQNRTVSTGGESDSSNLAAIVGVDLPSYLPISRKFWLRRIRLMVGTSIVKPGADLHLGVSWLPLLMGVQGEDFSIQAFSGYRIGFGGRRDSWTIMALTYNASSAISSILRAFTP